MKSKILYFTYKKFLKKVRFHSLKNIFFFLSLLYFCFYFFKNFSQISFNLDFEKNFGKLVFSFLFCILSIYLNAYSWKNIIVWFGKYKVKNNLVSFYVLTNVLKYIPGGIWHFVERFNFIKSISSSQLAFYSTLIEPYFMLSASFLLASIGVIFSPIYLFLVIPIFFLNRKLIYFVLKLMESFKGKAADKLKLQSSNYKLAENIKLSSFFPFKAFLLEVGFVLSKFIGFLICFNSINTSSKVDFLYLFVIFCLSWSIGLIVPSAPGGIGVFEACFLFFGGKNITQSNIFVCLIYFRLISTSADFLLSFPFLTRKIFRKF